jgi:hypothetical protein
MSDHKPDARRPTDAANVKFRTGSRIWSARANLLAGTLGVTLFAGAAVAAQPADAPVGTASSGPAPIVLAQATPPAATSAAGPSTAPAASAPASTGTSIIYGRPQSEYTAASVDKAIGTNIFARFFNYYYAEEGQATVPPDPNAPPTIRANWPAVPQSVPPMPFTDWPYGGTTLLGDNRTGSVDSPLMVAIAHTDFGQWLSKTGIQAYGWVDFGGNLSSSAGKGCGSSQGAQGGCNYNVNAPSAYAYNANTVQMNQAVIYLERTPDTVQTDHIDWGFRFSAIYGTDYHYTTSYGLASYQLLQHNYLYGYDFPMVYAELYIPKILHGLIIRAGRYISVPDIEAQLAPNNYMYTHSMTYTFDNYTNEGVVGSLAVTPHIIAQFGVTIGTEAGAWHMGKQAPNPVVLAGYADPLFPGKTYKVDPGARPSVTGCIRFDDYFNSDLNLCANGINTGTWGYNNLQWYGLTFYHKFNSQFHTSSEFYEEYQTNVPNLNNLAVQTLNNLGTTLFPNAQNADVDVGTPFGAPNILYNNPDEAQCKNHNALTCTARAYGFVTYFNYQPTPLDNVSLRLEWYDDAEGQRTGYAAVYYDVGIGVQHWLSPQIEFRPEFTEYWASEPSFGNGQKKSEALLSGDVIIHF